MNPLQPLVNNLMTVQRQLVGGLRHNGDRKLQPEQAAFLNDIITLAQALVAIKLPASVASGYLGSYVVDTNENASNLKTLATILGSSIVSNILTGAVLTVTTPLSMNWIRATEKIRPFGLKSVWKESGLIPYYGKDTTTETSWLVDKLDADGKQALKSAAAQLRTVIRLTKTALLITAGANAYHGYKRNGDSLGYGLAWLFAGPTGLGVAVQQGYAKRDTVWDSARKELAKEGQRIENLRREVRQMTQLQPT